MRYTGVVMLIVLVAAAGIIRAATPVPGSPNSDAVLAVKFAGLRNDHGNIKVALFKGPDGYPGDSSKAIQRSTVTITGGAAHIAFSGLEPGEYAIAVIHDEDSDNTFARNWLGMPREGFGASGIQHRTLGPPHYRDARFMFDGRNMTMTVTMFYYLSL